MTIDEAIKNYEKIADENQRVVDTGSVINDVAIYYQRRAGEYRQLAGWLKELKQLKGQESILDKIRAEIVEMRSKQNCSCADCLDIIDKYKAETEE